MTDAEVREVAVRFKAADPFLKTVPLEAIVTVLRSGTPRRFRSGELVLNVGQVVREGHFVLGGCLGTRWHSPSGGAWITELLGPRCWAGLELYYPEPQPRAIHEVFAVVDSQVLTYSREFALDFTRAGGWRALYSTQLPVRRLQNLSQCYAEEIEQETECRVVRALLRLHRVLETPVLPVTQSTLASLARCSRETAAVALRPLRNERIIRTGRGWIEILDPPRLQRFLEDGPVGP